MLKKKQALTVLNISSRQVRVDLAQQFVCGGVEDYFQYQARIATRGLTEEGFVTEVKAVIDAVELQYAPRRGMFQASCEQLAEGVAKVIFDKLGARRAQEINVIVYNLTGYVEYAWYRGEAVPVFPSLAKKTARKVRPQTIARSSC